MPTHTIAIVGTGPKGLQCLERLLAELTYRPPQQAVCIHLFTIGGIPGTSRIYHPDLPPYLPVNNMRHEEIVVTTATPERPCVAQLPTFVQWRTGRGISSDATVSRAQVGHFLAECAQLLVAAAPRHVKIQLHDAELIDVFTHRPELELRARRADGYEYVLSCEQLLLSTGHGPQDRSATIMVDEAILARDVIGIRGMGLAALDVILMLTQGRGGSFERTDAGHLEYRRSGNEPERIVPFCRSGVPILPSYIRNVSTDRQLRIFTLDRLSSMAQRLQRRLSWRRELLPLIARELRAQFRVAIEQYAMRKSETPALRSRPPPFSVKQLLMPYLLEHGCDDFEYASGIRKCIELLLGSETRDMYLDSCHSAVSTWYEISCVLDTLCRQELLDADSHVTLMNEISPMMRRIAFGANHSSMTKLLALSRAGIVDFSMLRSVARKIPEAAGAAILQSAGGRTLQLNSIIDAIIPTFDVRECQDDLYKTLLKNGVIRPHVLPGGRSTSGVTGAIDVAAKEQCAISRDGRLDKRISLTGIPMQGRLLNTWTITPDDFPAQWAERVCDWMQPRLFLAPQLGRSEQVCQ